MTRWSQATIALLLASTCGTSHALTLTLDEYQEKCKGAWAGQMIGVSYGAPYEFKAQGFIMEDPIREWQADFINNAIHQDDVYVELTFLKALEDHGIGISYEQCGKAFADSQYGLWHANRYGRDNCRNGIMPPLSGHPDYNEHADDIDFQIEADLFGIITPGMPKAMLKLCDRFGHIMNYGDGVYGGMFVSGMYCAAYFEDDVHTVVQRGLDCIPPKSKYAQLIADVIACHEEDDEDWRACWQLLEEKWAPYDLCPDGRGTPFNIDAKLNGGYIAMGLLFGDGDFEKTLEVSLRCGQDNDCNPSNAAGVLGCMLGYDGIPEQYTEGIPAIENEKFSHTEYDFASLVDACTGVVRELIEANGGEVTGLRNGETWQLPQQKYAPPKGLEQWVVIDQDLRLQAAPGIKGGRGVQLTWAEVPTATAYRLLRATSDKPEGVRIFGTKAATSYEDRSAPVGESVAYTVEVKLPETGWQSSEPITSFVFDPVAANETSDENLARSDFASADAAILTPKGGGLRDIEVIRDGIVEEQNYDSFDGKNAAPEDWYAIRFAKAVRVSSIEYVEGSNFHDGGWWLSLTAQVLDPESFEWRDCDSVQLSPEYDLEDHQEGRQAYTRWALTFDPETCAGVRIIGEPGGEADFTSIAELEAYYRP